MEFHPLPPRYEHGKSKYRNHIEETYNNITLRRQPFECLYESFQVLPPYFSSYEQLQWLPLPANHLTSLMQEMLKTEKLFKSDISVTGLIHHSKWLQ